jgi:hypothetical protein
VEQQVAVRVGFGWLLIIRRLAQWVQVIFMKAQRDQLMGTLQTTGEMQEIALGVFV